MATEVHATTAKGVDFLTTPVTEAQFLTVEGFDETQREVRKLARTFAEREVLPKVEAIDHQEAGVLRGLLRGAGEQGLLGVDVPEAYGGQDLGLVYAAIVASEIAEGSFAVAFGTQTTIGLLPIVYYGNDDQKSRFLPKMVSGETVSCYCLTEPGVGSDAMAIKTRATLSADGTHYLLNGTKQWISNGGIADIGIVFAKIDDQKYTAFIMDMHAAGVTTSPEEQKMGIKGSSTRLVYMENVQVPVENVLGEIGKGHKIAFNILNIGRLKLGAGGVGGIRNIMAASADYAQTRKAFGKSINQFGLIKAKLAGMAADEYAVEAIGFRTAGYIEGAREAAGADKLAQLTALEEFAAEASIAKVYGSEAVGRTADEGVQIHGGNGFMTGYAVEKAYRDARISRIFEGTNEINRLLAAGKVFERVMGGKLNLFDVVPEVEQQAQSGNIPDFAAAGVPNDLRSAVNALERAKRAAIYGVMKASMKYVANIKDEEEFLGNTGDILINLFAIDSAVGRALYAARQNDAQIKTHSQLANMVAWRLLPQLRTSLERIIESAMEGEDRAAELKLVRGYLADLDVNGTDLSRSIADLVIAKGGYPL
jgi:alkylation response protein AidB-like acyl-CoA dehydrogenase